MNVQNVFWRIISLRKPSEEEERRKTLKKGKILKAKFWKKVMSAKP